MAAPPQRRFLLLEVSAARAAPWLLRWSFHAAFRPAQPAVEQGNVTRVLLPAVKVRDKERKKKVIQINLSKTAFHVLLHDEHQQLEPIFDINNHPAVEAPLPTCYLLGTSCLLPFLGRASAQAVHQGPRLSRTGPVPGTCPKPAVFDDFFGGAQLNSC